jgi:hypothetical protein
VTLGQNGVETRGLAAFHVGLYLPFSEFDEFGGLVRARVHRRRTFPKELRVRRGVDERRLKSGSVAGFLLLFFLFFILATFLA